MLTCASRACFDSASFRAGSVTSAMRRTSAVSAAASAAASGCGVACDGAPAVAPSALVCPAPSSSAAASTGEPSSSRICTLRKPVPFSVFTRRRAMLVTALFSMNFTSVGSSSVSTTAVPKRVLNAVGNSFCNSPCSALGERLRASISRARLLSSPTPIAQLTGSCFDLSRNRFISARSIPVCVSVAMRVASCIRCGCCGTQHSVAGMTGVTGRFDQPGNPSLSMS